MRADWEVVIGLETHAQLATASKIFSGSSTQFGAAPNAQASAIDLALPGVLPVLNAGAVECAVKFGLAVGAKIAERSIFARKNYFYPDLPKGYQISQYEIPVVQGGSLAVMVAGAEKIVHLTRAHLEEDAGKSLHDDFAGMSGIDLNRAGTPLLEIVSEPVMHSSAEAVAYAKTLHSLVMWLGICDGNMQEGSFRCDANVSVRPRGRKEFGTRCEIKNLNSFRFMEKAIEFEIRRQIELIEEGGKVIQETRLYDPDKDETRSMRSKEDAMDYRYFPDPDLLPLEICAATIERIRAGLPELPQAARARFESQYGLTPYDAETLTANRDLATYFAHVVRLGADAKVAANWVCNQVSAELNRLGIGIGQLVLTPGQLSVLIQRISDGTINAKTARDSVYPALLESQGVHAAHWREHPDALSDKVDAIIESKHLAQISDSGAIGKIIDEVLAANPKSVAEFRSGKEKAFNALVGQAMKASKGKANPVQVNEILRRKLGP